MLDEFSPSYLEMLSDENGRIYGLPRDGYVLGMHINVALFREAGLVDEEGLPIYPKTLQEVAEYGQIIREKTGKAGLVFPASETYGGWLFTNIAWNFGCVGENALEYQDEDGRWVCNLHPTSAWRRWSTSATCAGSTTSSMPTRLRPTGRARILCWARAKRR